MDLLEAIAARHSVRGFTDKKIEGDVQAELLDFIQQCNEESGLHMQLILDEPLAFDCSMARYGRFVGVRNYLAVVGKDDADLDEKCGYFGEKVVLRAQQLGLNTCWVGLTYRKVDNVVAVAPGEKLRLVIALGYGATQGSAHKSKAAAQVMKVCGDVPDWFERGVEAALLAPTAVNQQKFVFYLADGSKNEVCVKAGMGFYAKVDLGIVKYHFEIGAGTENFVWAR